MRDVIESSEDEKAQAESEEKKDLVGYNAVADINYCVLDRMDLAVAKEDRWDMCLVSCVMNARLTSLAFSKAWLQLCHWQPWPSVFDRRPSLFGRILAGSFACEHYGNKASLRL